MEENIPFLIEFTKEYLSQVYQKNLDIDKKEDLILDFTDLFKGKKKKKPLKKFIPSENSPPPEEVLSENKTLLNTDAPLEIAVIPRNLSITIQELEERKYMNPKRWYCLSRPQYSKSCGISSLVSCWNYLFSTLGEGTLQPISQEYALELLGINPPYKDLDFGKFTGNETLINWFWKLNKIHNVRGRGKIVYKLHGSNVTHGVTAEEALSLLKSGLKDCKKSYIYHCYNHYMCPIGFESTPNKPHLAYAKNEEIVEFEDWIIIGEVSKCFPVFHVKKWSEIVKDIDCQFPEYFNIRKSHLGVQMKKGKGFTEGKYAGGNLHCLIEFSRDF